jgi:hypothetical protein
LGNTASFTRFSGSPVNKENKPFALTTMLTGGTWKETSTAYKAEYQFKTDGTGTMKYTAGGGQQTSAIAYSVVHDQGLDKDVLVIFVSGMNTFTAYSFTQSGNNNTITVTEIIEITMGQQGPAANYGSSVTFSRTP